MVIYVVGSSFQEEYVLYFTNIFSAHNKQRYVNNINFYYQKKDSSSKDWEKIKGDYYKVGNDIRKAIKNYVKQ